MSDSVVKMTVSGSSDPNNIYDVAFERGDDARVIHAGPNVAIEELRSASAKDWRDQLAVIDSDGHVYPFGSREIDFSKIRELRARNEFVFVTMQTRNGGIVEGKLAFIDDDPSLDEEIAATAAEARRQLGQVLMGGLITYGSAQIGIRSPLLALLALVPAYVGIKTFKDGWDGCNRAGEKLDALQQIDSAIPNPHLAALETPDSRRVGK